MERPQGFDGSAMHSAACRDREETMVAFPGSHQREAILHAVQAMYTKWQDFRISSFIFRPAVRPVPSSDIHEPSSTRFLRRPWNRLRAWGIPLQSGRFGQGTRFSTSGPDQAPMHWWPRP
jgi:hypothetical protein